MAYDPNKPEDYYYNNPNETNYPMSSQMNKLVKESASATPSEEELKMLEDTAPGYEQVSPQELEILNKGINAQNGSVELDVVARIQDVAQSKRSILEDEMNTTTDEKKKQLIQARISELDLAEAKAIQKEKPTEIKSYFDVGAWIKNLPSRAALEAKGLYYGAGEAYEKITAIPKEAAAWMLQLTGNQEKANKVRDEIQNAVDIWGGHIAQVKADRIKTFGAESWGLGENVGTMAPELSTAKIAKAIPMMIAEAGLSSARNELFSNNEVPLITKAMAISSDVVLAGIGLKLVDKILPPAQIKEFKDFIDSIDDPALKERMQKAITMMENDGIDNLSYSARDRILKNILGNKIIDDASLSKAIKMESEAAQKSAQKEKQGLYDAANAIADTTPKTSMPQLVSNFTQFDAKDAFKKESQKKIQQEFIEDLKDTGAMNARQLEDKLGTYKSYERASNDETKASYSAIIKFLQDEQNKILIASGHEGLYKPAREASKKFNVLFEGKMVKGEYGQSVGSKIAKIINKPEEFGVNKQLFGGTLNPNAASVYVKRIGGDMKTREASVINLIINGVDDISSTAGVETMISNYSKMDKNGIKIMLGEQGANQLRTNIDALTIVATNIKDFAKVDKDLSKDVINLAGAVMAFKISPYASVHVAINTAKDIANKISTRNGMAEEKSALSKRLADYAKDNPSARNILRAIMMMSGPNVQSINSDTIKRQKYDINPE